MTEVERDVLFQLVLLGLSYVAPSPFGAVFAVLSLAAAVAAVLAWRENR